MVAKVLMGGVAKVVGVVAKLVCGCTTWVCAKVCEGWVAKV